MTGESSSASPTSRSTDRPVVLITGCSSGIGRATAERFRAAGWRVWATSRDPADVADLAAAGCETAALDVTDDEQVEGVVEELVAAEGRIDCLVNNAGYGQAGAVEDVPVEHVRAQFDVNVFGPVRLVRAVLPHMRARETGTIINVSSILGRVAYPTRGIYAGSKHALEGTTDALRTEVAGFGVDVVLVRPGTVRTGFEERLAETRDAVGVDEGPYARGSAVVGAIQRRLEPFGVPPERVAAAVYRSAAADSSERRVLVGRDARLLLLADRLTPDAVTEWLFGLLVR